MSPLQYGTMRYIIAQRPLVSAARYIRQVTLMSLFTRKWVTIQNGRITATMEGEQVVEAYLHAKFAKRGFTADLAPTLQHKIRYYRVIPMRKRAVA